MFLSLGWLARTKWQCPIQYTLFLNLFDEDSWPKMHTSIITFRDSPYQCAQYWTVMYRPYNYNMQTKDLMTRSIKYTSTLPKLQQLINKWLQEHIKTFWWRTCSSLILPFIPMVASYTAQQILATYCVSCKAKSNVLSRCELQGQVYLACVSCKAKSNVLSIFCNCGQFLSKSFHVAPLAGWFSLLSTDFHFNFFHCASYGVLSEINITFTLRIRGKCLNTLYAMCLCCLHVPILNPLHTLGTHQNWKVSYHEMMYRYSCKHRLNHSQVQWN